MSSQKSSSTGSSEQQPCWFIPRLESILDYDEGKNYILILYQGVNIQISVDQKIDKIEETLMSFDNEKEKSDGDEKSQKKRTRRTRKDEEGRDFTCPCGKSYLSYPALYTHVKTKHQGKMPKDVAYFKAQPKEVSEEYEQKKDPLLIIKQVLDKYFPSDSPEPYPTPLKQEQREYLGRKINYWEQIMQLKRQDSSNNLTDSIDVIIGRFLKLKACEYLYQLMFFLEKGISDEHRIKNFGGIGNGTHLANYFNSFLGDKKLRMQIPRGSPLSNSLLTCKVIHSFGIWVFNHFYTNLLTKINSYFH